MSMSLEHGQAFALPLPDLDAMSPPAFSNRQSSVPRDDESYAHLHHPQPQYHHHQQHYARHSPSASISDASADGELTPQANSYPGQFDESEESPLALKSTDLPANDSALLTSSESSNSNSDSASNTSSDNDHSGELGESSSSRRERPTSLPSSQGNSSSGSTATRKSTQWGDLPTPTMGSSTSFSFGNGNGNGNGSSASTPLAGSQPNGTSSASDSGAEPDLAALANPASNYPVGALAPMTAISNSHRRPGPSKHGKSYSERTESPFRLDIGSAQRDRRRELSEGGPRHRPSPLPTPMLRKKSGELVRSSMKHDPRAKSAPTTPTGPKAVHFDQQLERVKTFLAAQRPTAVSRDGSPVETETEDDSEAAFPFPPMTTSIPAQIILHLPQFQPNNNLPELGHRDIGMETLEIAADYKSLKGTAVLRNIAFEKRLSIRFTFDEWQTVSEVTGEWQSTLVGGYADRWSFVIKLQDMLARIEDKKMFIALKYTVDGREIWDNNGGENYKAEFRRQAARSQAVVGGARAARHEWAVTNPGQASERMADLRRELDRLVADQDDGFNTADDLVLGKGLRYSPRFLGDEAVPLAQAPSASTFSARYDFGASLKTAATHRNSPQSSHAILDNPYFASPQLPDAVPAQWRGAAAIASPALPMSSGLPGTAHQYSPPKPSFSSLYNDGSAQMTTSIIGGMPATTFVDSSSKTPPASFSGHSYYQPSEISGTGTGTSYGMPNYLLSLQQMQSSYFPDQETAVPMSASSSSSGGSNSTTHPFISLVSPTDSPSLDGLPPSELMGGAPLTRQKYNSFPPSRANVAKVTGASGSAPSAAAARATISPEAFLEPTLDDRVDLLDRSIYSPAVSPPSLSPPRRQSPPPRPVSPDDLLSPSPSCASTDTSISTPQSPGGSPPLRAYAPYIATGPDRPDMGSDTYFNFVHRCKLLSHPPLCL